MSFKIHEKTELKHWQAIEDHEIDEIRSELLEFSQKILPLKDWVNEFSNTLAILKKKKGDKRIVKNTHIRALQISELLKDIEKRFKKVKSQEHNVEDIDKHIEDNFSHMITIFGPNYTPLNTLGIPKEGIFVGRNTPECKRLSGRVSRKHILLKVNPNNQLVDCKLLSKAKTCIQLVRKFAIREEEARPKNNWEIELGKMYFVYTLTTGIYQLRFSFIVDPKPFVK